MIATRRAGLADLARVAWPVAFMFLGAAMLFVFPPTQDSFYPQCPVHYYFHILCPGCGGTRALAALLHGRFAEALQLNALVTLLMAIAAVYSGMYSYRILSRRRMIWPQPSPTAIYAMLAVSLAFTVARNL